ncbi:aminopeptidase [Vagococcus acidifermentans]|uniref:Aminopeptidase n=1 Tax=Vagococcus acidifermentans TaxID=564710 RepID=A0A430APN3_9ENTE|nr:aminopeptidase [Vagococcus acidifermentans]RSU10081.1 aminopeptidase [Vagococcus acidifermentans]
MTLANFSTLLQKYAELIVKTGVNVQKSHTVVVQVSVDQRQLARLIVKEAYQAGAKQVLVQWNDDIISREFYLHADDDILTTIPQYRIDETLYWIENDASRISVVSQNPDALAGVDTQRVAAYQAAAGKALVALRQTTQSNKNSWTVVAAAGPEWAAKVFPELSDSDAQVAALWEAIFNAARVDTDDPIAAWQAHDHTLTAKAELLNHEQFDALHYRAPGTDLIVGLPKNHRWEGGGSTNSRGERFMANMPTEEVFTAPDARRIDGTVVSTKPLSYAGSTISGMSFTFKDGKVVDASAEQGEDVLKHLLAIDDGAKSLGEVALVPHRSPISQSGITFYNTLFDENASNHLALGSAYAFSIEGGTEMTEEELADAGLNRSQTHVDFMIGSELMDIDGIRQDGSRVPIFRGGEWA